MTQSLVTSEGGQPGYLTGYTDLKTKIHVSIAFNHIQSMNSHAKIVVQGLLIIGVHVQLSLLDVDALLDKGSFSALTPCRDPRLDQGAGIIP